MSDALTAVVPPPELNSVVHHWLRRRVGKFYYGLRTPFQWTGLYWCRDSDGLVFTPAHLAGLGWSYVSAIAPGEKTGPGSVDLQNAREPRTPAEAVMGIPTGVGTPVELRPPPEHAGKPHHWVQFTVGAITRTPTVWTWGIHHSGKQAWLLPGISDTLFPEQARGWRYIEPAEYDVSAWDREQRLRVTSDKLLRAAGKRGAELEKHIADLRREQRAEDSARNWSA